MSAATLSTLVESVGETVTDAVATGVDLVHDLATTASREVPELTDKVSRRASTAARQARRRLPGNRRRSRPPWAKIVVLVVGLAVIGAVVARRRSGPSRSGAVAGLQEHTERARVAATG